MLFSDASKYNNDLIRNTITKNKHFIHSGLQLFNYKEKKKKKKNILFTLDYNCSITKKTTFYSLWITTRNQHEVYNLTHRSYYFDLRSKKLNQFRKQNQEDYFSLSSCLYSFVFVPIRVCTHVQSMKIHLGIHIYTHTCYLHICKSTYEP